MSRGRTEFCRFCGEEMPWQRTKNYFPNNVPCWQCVPEGTKVVFETMGDPQRHRGYLFGIVEGEGYDKGVQLVKVLRKDTKNETSCGGFSSSDHATLVPCWDTKRGHCRVTKKGFPVGFDWEFLYSHPDDETKDCYYTWHYSGSD